MFKNIIIAFLIVFLFPFKVAMYVGIFGIPNEITNTPIEKSVTFNDTFENNLDKLEFEDSDLEDYEFTNF